MAPNEENKKTRYLENEGYDSKKKQQNNNVKYVNENIKLSDEDLSVRSGSSSRTNPEKLLMPGHNNSFDDEISKLKRRSHCKIKALCIFSLVLLGLLTISAGLLALFIKKYIEHK